MPRDNSFTQPEIPGCPAKIPVGSRPLINIEEAQDLESIFKVLANATRLRLLHALIQNTEMCVTELAETIEMKPQAVSNQLQRLVHRGILGYRRNGNNIYYRIVDPCVTSLFDHGLCLSEDATKRLCHVIGKEEDR